MIKAASGEESLLTVHETLSEIQRVVDATHLICVNALQASAATASSREIVFRVRIDVALLLECLIQGDYKKIEAIKLYRQLMEVPLKDAKDCVEAFHARYRQQNLTRRTGNEERGV